MSGIAVRRDGVLGHHGQGARRSPSTGCSAARSHDRIKAYANGWYTVERTPGGVPRGGAAVVERGYRALKFDPFGDGALRARPRRADALGLAGRGGARRRRAGGRDPGGDARALRRRTAIRVAGQLEPFKPAWLEEPVPPENLKALAKVAEQGRLPIATGERIHDRIEFRELFESQAVDIIQPDVGHIGGILETRKLAATAETHYVLVAPHNVGGPVLTAASLHLAALHARTSRSRSTSTTSPTRRSRRSRPGAAAGRRRLLRAARRARAGRRAGRRLRRRVPAAAGALRPLGRRLGQRSGGRSEQRSGSSSSPGELGLVDEPVGAPGPGEALVRIALRGHLRQRPRGARGRPARRVRPLPGHPRPRVVRDVVEEVGAGRRTRGWSAARSSARASATARRATACRPGETTLCEAGYEETGFTQPGAWNDYPAAAGPAAARAARRRRPARRRAAGAGRVRRRGVPAGRDGRPASGWPWSAAGRSGCCPCSCCGPPRRASWSWSRGARPGGAGARHGRRPAVRARGRGLPRLRRRDRGRRDAALRRSCAVDLARRGGRVVLTGIPGDVRRRRLAPEARHAGGQRVQRLRRAVAGVGAHGAGVRRRAARPDAAGHPRAAAERDPRGLPGDDLQDPAVGKILLRP